MKYLKQGNSFTPMRAFLFIIFTISSFLTLKAQPTDGLIAYYSFDACDANEDTGSGADGIIMGNAICGCGVKGNGLEFDGSTTVQILGNLDILFTSDFTISFFHSAKPTI